MANKNSLYEQRAKLRKELAAASTILIIEDNRFQQMILRQILEDCGFSDIAVAENGLEGLELTRNVKPDLIILDIEMPQMNGLEFCRNILADGTLRHIPILVQTGRTQSADKEEIFDAGACDYVAKPIDSKELVARLFSHLERVKWSAQLAASHARIQEELSIAAQTHRILFPNDSLLSMVKQTYGITTRHYEIVSSELGGDFWGLHHISHSQLALYMVDFSGHGVNAALNTFRLHAMMQQLYHYNLHHGNDAGYFLTLLNKELAAVLPVGQFATMFYGVVDINTNQLNYAVAGCPTPFIFRANGDIQNIDGSGFLLGAISDSIYTTSTIEFGYGDMLLLYSDALTESPDIEGNIMQEQDIISYFAKKPELGFDKLVRDLQRKYSATWPDDLTIIAYYNYRK